jgi:hypothetical protein
MMAYGMQQTAHRGSRVLGCSPKSIQRRTLRRMSPGDRPEMTPGEPAREPFSGRFPG